ncbi:TPA: hypothetical protein ACNVL8_004620 [Escherichia coli]
MSHTPKNPHLAATSKMDWPRELLAEVQARAQAEDENVSSLIRKVMAAYVGWTGPTRHIKDYDPGREPEPPTAP